MVVWQPFLKHRCARTSSRTSVSCCRRGSRFAWPRNRYRHLQREQRTFEYRVSIHCIRAREVNQLEDELLLNRTAQSYVSMDSTRNWFAGLERSRRRAVLGLLWRMAQQAGWRADRQLNDTASVIDHTKPQLSANVVSIIRGRPSDEMLERVVESPESTWGELFEVLFGVFTEADLRRRSTRGP